MLYGENRTNTNGYRYQRTLDAPTQKLFKAIDDENLEDFRQAIEEGADVYARDEKNMRPLESIKDKLVNVLSNKSACAVSSDKQKITLKEMTKLLTTKQLFKAIGDKNLENFKQAIKEGADVYARDEKGMTPLMIIARARVYDRQQPVLKEMVTLLLFKAIDDGNLEDFKEALAEGAVNAFDKEGMTPLMSIVTNLSASSETEKEYQNMIRLLLLHRSIDVNISEQNNNNTVLHLAMCFQQKKTLQLLLSHPNINTYLTNKNHQNPEECARQNRAGHLIIEIQKAQKGKELLAALSSGNICQAKTLLNQELHPNCWRRTQDGRIKTPLSLIIRLCLRTITEDEKEVLTKLLKHKDLDFSYEQYAQLKQTIEQAITERLTGTINKKDLDDVKKLVEDNDFMNYAIIIAAWRNVNNPIESIVNYLNEKFPANTLQPLASTNDIPVGSEQVIQELKGELERTKAQLIEKERELDRVVCERTRGIDKISQLEEDLRQEKSAQKTKINDLNSEVTRLNRIVCGRASDTVEISRLKRDLKQVREERDRLLSENRLLRSNKNEKSSQAISSGRKLSNYASACFILLGVYTVVACLVIEDYPGIISAFFTAVALAFFLLGCCNL
ncbi:ankyrin repeat domain-containing protein [Wolbachia endosymbiont of Drosophila barbarae]|uniref:ankyrin repeat domain-containing protein n=1 Tax=Wolbachia endosymbiont of Drosophila barbarae TaxID=3377043 RepID=UPI00381309D6